MAGAEFAYFTQGHEWGGGGGHSFVLPYSPELNPQEYVNQDVKTNILGKKRPINKASMRINVEDFMQKRQKGHNTGSEVFPCKP